MSFSGGSDAIVILERFGGEKRRTQHEQWLNAKEMQNVDGNCLPYSLEIFDDFETNLKVR